MGFNLGNWLEEKWADVNQWDGGKTGATIRAARKAPPAVTPSPNQRRFQAQMTQTRLAQPGGGGSVQAPTFNPQRQTGAQYTQPAMPRFSVQQTLNTVQQPLNPRVDVSQNANIKPNRTPEQQRRLAEIQRRHEAEQEAIRKEGVTPANIVREFGSATKQFGDYLNPFGEKGLFGVEQQKTYEKATEPVVNRLQQVMDKVNESDKEDGFQWSSKGDYGRFALNLLPGMAQGVIGAPTSVGQAVSGKRVNDNGQVEDINAVQRAGSLADATLSTAGLGVGGSGVLLKSIVGTSKALGKPGAKAALEFIKSAGTESVEELVQTLAQDMADNGELNATLKDYRDAGGLGFLGGGMMHGAGKAVSVAKPAIKENIQSNIDEYKAPVIEARAKVEAAKRENVMKHPEILEIQSRLQFAAERFRVEENQLVRNTIKTEAAGLYDTLQKTIAAKQKQAAIEAVKAVNKAGKRFIPGGTLGGELASGFKDAQAKGRVFDGVDGKPRFEVDDSGAKLNTQALDAAQKQGIPAKLGDVLDHNKLYEQYPDLKDTYIARVDMGGQKNSAEYDPNKNLIMVDKNATDVGTLLHEVQHAIQTKEGFANGTSPEANYRNYTAENASIKRGLADVNSKLNSETTPKGQIAKLRKQRDGLIKQLNDTQDQYGNVKDGKAESMRKYRLDAGEAEARAVQARMDMPMSERYVKPEGETLYHGTTEKWQGDEPRFPLYTTPNKNYAQVYADSTAASSIAKGSMKQADGSKVHEFKLNPKARVLDATDPKVRKMLDEEYFGKWSMSDKFYPGKNGHLDWTEGENLAEFIAEKKLPYDAIKLDEGGGGVDPQFGVMVGDKGTSVLALNRNAISPNKPRSTFYDSLDVPKKDLIVRQGEGKAMSVDPNTPQPKPAPVEKTAKELPQDLNGKPLNTGDTVTIKDSTISKGDWVVKELRGGQDGIAIVARQGKDSSGVLGFTNEKAV